MTGFERITADGPAPPFRLLRPTVWRAGLIVASPHSGRDYPAWFVAESQLPMVQLRSSEDAFVDHLAAQALGAGAVVLTATAPRALIDLNRAEDDLDPVTVAGLGRTNCSARAMSGLGVVPRVVGQGRAIRAAAISVDDARARVAAFWTPYHVKLQALMADAVQQFGQAVLIDLHSMPRDALTHLGHPLPELVLGDLNGRSSAPEITAALSGSLRAGDVQTGAFRMRMNSPFAGAHILARYGRPSAGRHALQLEIDRTLYMDELRVVPHTGLGQIAARMRQVFARMADQLDQSGNDLAAVAAE